MRNKVKTSTGPKFRRSSYIRLRRIYCSRLGRANKFALRSASAYIRAINSTRCGKDNENIADSPADCRKILLTALLIAASTAMQAQERRRSLGPYTMYEQIIYQAKQERILEWLADDMSEGRATGTHAGMSAARFIEVLFRQYGLEPLFGSSFYQPFIADSLNGTIGRNVAGIVRSAVPSDEYVLISAHYDHLGILNGNTYNGADDNASGVTVLLNLADMFGTMKKTKTGPDKNIIFAALDAKELNMAGSKALIDKLLSEEESTAYTTSGTTDPTAATAADRADSASSPEEEFPGIPKDRIICAINIDQIGTVLEPVHEADTNFVIVLGEKTLRKETATTTSAWTSTTPSTAARTSPSSSTSSPTRSSSTGPASPPWSSPPASTATPTRPRTTRTSSPTPS